MCARPGRQAPSVGRRLQGRAVNLPPDVAPEQRLGSYWAMVICSYPFAASVATGVGKLLTLQGDAALHQLTRWIAEAWGDRSTMAGAVQRVVRSMV